MLPLKDADRLPREPLKAKLYINAYLSLTQLHSKTTVFIQLWTFCYY